ncbi:MAG: transposase, partial [Acidaminococcales bacterium]|nr:transposase [Acidaminococcales bacterium]
MAYVDETGIDTYLCREHCWSPKGLGAIGLVSGKKCRRAGIAAAKMVGRILSPLQYEGTMDSQLFGAWLENVPMDELDQQSAIVVDKAAFHRKSKLVPLAEKHGHRPIFLPAHSPELNPIENFWAWL